MAPLSYNVFFFPSASFKELTQRVERLVRRLVRLQVWGFSEVPAEDNE